MIKVRKRYLTLLEMLIAFVLLAVLLSFLFGTFREIDLLSKNTQDTQNRSFQIRYLETRLSFIFERLAHDHKDDVLSIFYLDPADKGYTAQDSLVFTFGNGVRKNPLLSSNILGRLYLDNDRQLCLAIWPIYSAGARQHMQKEVLFENVIDFSMEFYAASFPLKQGASTQSGATIDSDKKSPRQGVWQKEWYKNYKQMPGMIKITLKYVDSREEFKQWERGDTKLGRESVLVFVLPSKKNLIYYPPD